MTEERQNQPTQVLVKSTWSRMFVRRPQAPKNCQTSACKNSNSASKNLNMGSVGTIYIWLSSSLIFFPLDKRFQEEIYQWTWHNRGEKQSRTGVREAGVDHLPCCFGLSLSPRQGGPVRSKQGCPLKPRQERRPGSRGGIANGRSHSPPSVIDFHVTQRALKFLNRTKGCIFYPRPSIQMSSGDLQQSQTRERPKLGRGVRTHLPKIAIVPDWEPR